MSDKEFNKQYAAKIGQITDTYFRQKLESGLIKYEPDLWEEAQLAPIDENKL